MVGMRASCQPMPVLMIVAPHGLDGPGEGDHLVERGAARDEVQHGQPVDDDEVLADGLAHPPHDLHGEAHAVLVRAAPAVGAVVGLGGDELVDEVALGAHDLHAVVAGLPGEAGGAGVVVDGPLDLGVGERAGHEGADRRLEGARGDEVAVVGVPAEVQDLHRDPAALAVHGLGDGPVLLGLRVRGELGAALGGPPLLVGRDAAGHDQAHSPARPLRVEGGHALEAALGLLQADVHGAHQHTVGQGGEAQVERVQQVRVTAHRAPPSRSRALCCRGPRHVYATSCITRRRDPEHVGRVRCTCPCRSARRTSRSRARPGSPAARVPARTGCRARPDRRPAAAPGHC